MTALNPLEVLAKFLGNHSPLGLNLDMVRKGLFEEQLKLAGQPDRSDPKDASSGGSLPLVKKTLPVGPIVPASPPDGSDSSRQKEKDDSSLTESPAKNSPPDSNSSRPESTSRKESARSEEESALKEPQEPCLTGPDPSTPTLPEGASLALGAQDAALSGNGLKEEMSANSEEKKGEISDSALQADSFGQLPPLGAGGNSSTNPEASSPAQQQESSPSPQKEVPLPQGVQRGDEGQKNTFLQHFSSVHSGEKPQDLSTSLAGGAGEGGKKVEGVNPSLPSPAISPVSTESLPSTGIAEGIPVPMATSTSGVQTVSPSAGSGSESVPGNSSGSTSGVSRVGEDGKPTSSSTAPTKAKSTTETDGSSQEASVQRVRFVQRVARAFQSLRDGGGSVRLRLSPPELGSLRIEMTVREGVMRARLEVENQSARTAILENLPALRERLAQQDIRVEQFDVEIGGGSSDSGSPQSEPREQRQTSFSQQSPGRSRTAKTTSGPPAPTPFVSSESTKLNIVI